MIDLSNRAPEIADLFAFAGFHGSVSVHLARTPFIERMWSHLTPPLSENATQKRRFEFSDGRELANRCLASLGAEPQMIGRGLHREPIWPVGICGSITHTEGLVAAVAGSQNSIPKVGLGLDAERISSLEALDRAQAFTREERAFLSNLGEVHRATFATIFFSAKDAIFKAQFPFTSSFVDYHQVELRPETAATSSGSGRLHVRHDVPQLDSFAVSAFYNAIDEFVITGCVVTG